MLVKVVDESNTLSQYLVPDVAIQLTGRLNAYTKKDHYKVY